MHANMNTCYNLSNNSLLLSYFYLTMIHFDKAVVYHGIPPCFLCIVALFNFMHLIVFHIVLRWAAVLCCAVRAFLGKAAVESYLDRRCGVGRLRG